VEFPYIPKQWRPILWQSSHPWLPRRTLWLFRAKGIAARFLHPQFNHRRIAVNFLLEIKAESHDFEILNIFDSSMKNLDPSYTVGYFFLPSDIVWYENIYASLPGWVLEFAFQISVSRQSGPFWK
jgi:hypothetical protein